MNGIWLERNRVRFNKARFAAHMVISRVHHWIQMLGPPLPLPRTLSRQFSSLLAQLRISPFSKLASHQVVKWLWPRRDWIKLNVDGSALGNPGPLGRGGLGRDCEGNFIFAFSSGYGTGSSSRAELRAISEGLKKCADLGFTRIEVASDSKSSVAILSDNSTPAWSLSYWCARIRDLRESLNFSIVHTPREANAVADNLARRGSSSQATSFYSAQSDLPDITKGLLFLDKVTLGYLREI